MSLSGTSRKVGAQCSIATVSPSECNTGPALSLVPRAPHTGSELEFRGLCQAVGGCLIRQCNAEVSFG